MGICLCGHYEDTHGTHGCCVSYCQCGRYRGIQKQWRRQEDASYSVNGKIWGEKDGVRTKYPEKV